MRKAKFIYLIPFFGILSDISYSQTDNLGIDKARSFKLYISWGGGYGSEGCTLGMSSTFLTSKNWGMSVSYKTNILKNVDIPYDYFNENNHIFVPMDYLSLISFDLAKEFTSIYKLLRFGIEAGPAYVKDNVAHIELNPSYYPPRDGSANKYFKTRISNKTVGLTLRAKAEFVIPRLCGLELGAFTNINSIQSVFGIELYINQGKVSE